MPNGSQANGYDLGQNFLSNFGFDSVIADVMQDMDTQGNPVPHYPAYISPGITPTTATATTLPVQHPLPQTFLPHTNGSLNPPSSGPTLAFGHTMYTDSAMQFSSVTTATPALDNLGLLAESPPLDAGSMDWTLWDDMVTQYGIEGQTANPAASGNAPVGHLGELHWF